jgi:2-polyprenyl-3-methyl-5-hydroxy-6-metoxy-1,4-benzoquinol methylase
LANAVPIKRDTPCYHCGASGFLLHLAYPGEPRFDLLRCSQCGFLCIREIPTPDKLTSYYQENYYRAKDAGRFSRPFEAAVRWFRQSRARALRRELQPGARVLDVGCGRGILLATLKNRGFSVVGTQLSVPAARHIERQYGIDVFVGELPEARFEPASFDAVVILHVLEHTVNPAAYLEMAGKLLKPGGLLLVEVPNAGSFTARVSGINWLHWDLPRHLHHFAPASLNTLLEESGFAVIRHGSFSLEYGPFGILQAALNLLPGARRHFLFQELSSGRIKMSPKLLLHASLAALLAPLAILWCAIASLAGSGDMITVWSRKPA